VAEPDAYIEAIADQIAHSIANGDVQGEAGVFRKERLQARRQHEITDAAVDVDT
jgi:hypothetical protein